MTKDEFGRIIELETAKEIWDVLSKVNEGISTRRETRMDVLRNKFNNFKRKCSESVQDSYLRLVTITNELKGLGATDVQNHDVVKRLLRSLDDSFNTLVLMIQSSWDYKTKNVTDVLERLNTHELLIEGKMRTIWFKLQTQSCFGDKG